MSAFDFFQRMRELHEVRAWGQLQKLLSKPHRVLPGEREVFLELRVCLGQRTKVQLDVSGFHVIPKQRVF